MEIPEVIKSEKLVEGFVSMRIDYFSHTPPYYTLETKGPAVVVLATTDDGRYILNHEYRHPTKKILLSCPGGYLEPNEDPVVGGMRELLEETGYQTKDCFLMGSAYPYPGISDQLLYFVRAKRAKKISHPTLEPAEILETSLLSDEEITYSIQSGKAIDSTLLSAIQFSTLAV